MRPTLGGRSLRYAAAALLAGGLPAWADTASAPLSSETVSVARGAALFEGREPLAGKIRDHVTNLPPAVVACGNCHGRKPRSSTLPNEAPVLDAPSLLTPASRRNGPVSTYDQSSFCKALRTDIDPRAIVLGRAMPLFVISSSQCESLWMFLTSDTSR